MLQTDRTVVVLVDYQVKLLRAIHEQERVVDAARRLAAGAKVLGVPVVWTEQNPAGLGPTIDVLAGVLDGEPITKRAFSCCGEEAFARAMEAHRGKTVLLAGIESHVCVYQTARDLLAGGYDVEVVCDAVSSRTPDNRRIGLTRMLDAGAKPTSVEMALFDLLGVAEGEAFKQILPIVK